MNKSKQKAREKKQRAWLINGVIYPCRDRSSSAKSLCTTERNSNVMCHRSWSVPVPYFMRGVGPLRSECCHDSSLLSEYGTLWHYPSSTLPRHQLPYPFLCVSYSLTFRQYSPRSILTRVRCSFTAIRTPPAPRACSPRSNVRSPAMFCHRSVLTYRATYSPIRAHPCSVFALLCSVFVYLPSVLIDTRAPSCLPRLLALGKCSTLLRPHRAPSLFTCASGDIVDTLVPNQFFWKIKNLRPPSILILPRPKPSAHSHHHHICFYTVN